jgi:hypothetical protein
MVTATSHRRSASRDAGDPKAEPPETPLLRSSWRRWPNLVLMGLAVLLVGWVFVSGGWQAGRADLAIAATLILPGELLLRVAPGPWRLSTLERFAVSVALSYVIGVVLAGALAELGILDGRGMLAAALVFAVLAGLSRRRWRPPAVSFAPTATAFLIIVVAAAASSALYHVYPYVGDRIFLGQLDVSLDVLRAGHVPSASTAFDHAAVFPVNYVFYGFFLAWPSHLSGGTGYPAWSELAAALRGAHLALFASFWMLVGRELLRICGRGVPKIACWAALPLLMLLNLNVQGKFREALVEGFAMALGAVALWAVMRWTRDGDRRAALVAFALIASLVGTHLPSLVSTMLFCGAWLVVADESGRATHLTRGRSVYLWLRRLALRGGFLVAALAVGGLALRTATGHSPVALTNTAISSGSSNGPATLRALKLLIDLPLARFTSTESLLNRRWDATALAVVGPYVWAAVLVGVLALIGLALTPKRQLLRGLAWCAIAALLVLAYCGVGMLVSGGSLTPANVIMRNTFYIWIPFCCAVLIGLQCLIEAVDGLVAGRRRLIPLGALIAPLILVVAIVPLVQDKGSRVVSSGWIARRNLTPDGLTALRWVAHHTPRNARVALSETSYGTRLYTDRTIVTEGKATIESPLVVAAANDVIAESVEFFLPVRSPQLFIHHDIDYVVVGSNLTRGLGSLAGTPVLRGYPQLNRFPFRLFRSKVPYLKGVFRAGAVRVYRVIPGRLPTFQEREVKHGEPIPACRVQLCITRVVYDGPVRCGLKHLSSESQVCLVRTRGPAESARF